MRLLAPFTLTRTALIGAAQTVWLLEPKDRPERVKRAWMVAADEAKNAGTLIGDYTQDSSVKDNVTEALMDNLVAERARTRRAAENAERQAGGTKYDATKTIIAAAKVVRGTVARTENEWLERAFAYEWRMASGSAHARSWPVRLRTSVATGTGPDRALDSTLGELVPSLGAAVLLTEVAVDLWKQRAAGGA